MIAAIYVAIIVSNLCIFYDRWLAGWRKGENGKIQRKY